MSFDPYYAWLGIPPDEQPADHYRLLGIRRFEPNANVIEQAAERQLLLLKTMQNGPCGALTQQLMNEVTAARVCLLDAQTRSDYDAKLRQHAADRETRELKLKPADMERPAHRARPPWRMPSTTNVPQSSPQELRPSGEDLSAVAPLRPADPSPLDSSSVRRPVRGPTSLRRLGSGGVRRSAEQGSPGLRLWMVLGGLAIGVYIGATLLLMLVYGSGRRSRSSDEGVGRDNPAASSVDDPRAPEGPGAAPPAIRKAPVTKQP